MQIRKLYFGICYYDKRAQAWRRFVDIPFRMKLKFKKLLGKS